MQNKSEWGIDGCINTLEETLNDLLFEGRLTHEQLVAPKTANQYKSMNWLFSNSFNNVSPANVVCRCCYNQQLFTD